jgi:hypothetical protein
MSDTLAGNPYLGTSRNPFNYEKIEQVSRDIVTEWLTLEEITQQLNLFQDESQDSYLSSIELATRMAIEDYLGMSIFPVQYKVYYGTFNGMGGTQVSLDLPEVSQGFQGQAGITINAVEYYNGNTPPVLVAMASSTYYYDPTGNKVVVSGFPETINTFNTNPIVVTYTCNANPISQYPVIKQAGLMLLTHIYNNRSTVGQTVGVMAEIPFGVSSLLRPYKPLVM